MSAGFVDRGGARLATGLLVLLAAACRGEPSARPPIHPIQDMRKQPKYLPGGASAFFADGRASRTPPAGTVPSGGARADEAFFTGATGAGFVARVPVPVDAPTLKRGQERYDVYCSPCHDRAGSGRGIVVQRGYPPPVDLTGGRVRAFADGELFGVVTGGVRSMPSYASQIPERDRWAIVAWLRVLQRSQHAAVEDVPPERRDRIEPEGP